ncbi:MAG: hypothetical protein AUG75_06170 [Cyanobacteria bacterium 13_1_20CM_4_61_6]|nr:MAG: hypothetical protein AUG75_06170 [Cyanobacteria bacterium 13_1_20CM_4_61_6]
MLVAYLQTERLSFLLLAGVTGAWGLLTKLPGLTVGLAMIYATLTILHVRRRLNSRTPATIGLVALLALLPAVAYYLWALHLAYSYPPYHLAGEGNWLWNDGLRRWLDKNYFLPLLSWHFNYWVWTQPVIVLVAFGTISPFCGFGLPEHRRDFASGRNTSAKAPWLFHYWLLGGVFYYVIGAKELMSNGWNFQIINPPAAALAGHAIITIASFIAKITPTSVRSLLKVAIIASSLATIGVLGTKRLRLLYYPFSEQGYELGLALRQVSQPRDLVVTIANDLGNPIVIYYSQRRGWPFPPPTPSRDFVELPADDRESIQMFEELRAKGAAWLGIVAAQQGVLRREHPLLLAHFEHTSPLYRRDPKWHIYSIIPGDKKN